jgi:hypothetical protein
MAVRLSALRSGRALLTRNICLLLVLIYVGGPSAAEGLDSFKKCFHLIIGSLTRDLVACSVVP